MSSSTDIAVITIYVILVITDVIGNFLLVYIVMSTRKRQRQVRDTVVLNMSIADLMVGIFFFPRHVLRHAFTHPHGSAGDWLCKLLTGGNLAWVGATASSFYIIVLAFERFFAVIYPFKQRFTLKKVKILIIVCWLYAALFMFPLFLVVVYDEASGSCKENWAKDSEASAYSTLCLIFLLVIPVLLMAYLYGRVVRRLWFTKSQSAVCPVQRSCMVKSRKSVTKMLLIVTAVYIVCWSTDPTLYMLLASSWNDYNPMYTLPEALVLLNSSANPIIFTLYSQRFRQQLMRLLGWRRNSALVLSQDHNNTTRKGTNQPLEEMRVEGLTLSLATQAQVSTQAGT
jgi:hypothetical protein